MSANNSNLASSQLLDLLLTLKKTTPAAARGILNSQPEIANALITLMVSMGAVKLDVFQKTLADFQASAGQGIQPTPEPILSTSKQQQIPQPTHIPLHSTTPVPAVPPYLRDQPPNPYSNPYRTATPPHATPTPPMASAPPVQPPYGAYQNGYHHHQSAPSHGAYPTPGPSGPPQYGSSAPAGGYPGYGPPSTQQAPAPDLAATLAAIPDEQKALVLRVVQMTPEQIHALPPQERGTYIQIRATLGVPTPGP